MKLSKFLSYFGWRVGLINYQLLFAFLFAQVHIDEHQGTLPCWSLFLAYITMNKQGRFTKLLRRPHIRSFRSNRAFTHVRHAFEVLDAWLSRHYFEDRS